MAEHTKSERLVFTGPTGIEHRTVLERLALYYVTQEGVPIAELENLDAEGVLTLPEEKRAEILNSPKVQEIIKVYHVGDAIEDIVTFLDSYNEKRREAMWRDAFQQIQKDIEDAGPKYALISMHLTYKRFARTFSPVDWESIREIRPTRFVTLIDDVYSMWQRICCREEERHLTGSYFRLKELATWRSEEILLTDHLAKYIFPGEPVCKKNLVVAVKHPVSMLYRLLFHPERLVIYIGFHVTDTRDSPEKRTAIDAFRWKMHEAFTVFDPLTIDEKILEFVYQKAFGHRVSEKEFVPPADPIALDESARWAMGPDGSKLLLDDCSWPKTLDPLEIKEVGEALTHQIQIRDYRLIDQVDRIGFFRPFYQGGHSMGMASELQYARDVAFVPFAAVHDIKEDGDLDKRFFARPRVAFDTIGELIEDFLKHQETKTGMGGE